MNLKRTLQLSALSGVAFLSTAAINHNEGDHAKYFEISKNIEIFANLFKEINTYYVDEIDPGKLMRTGLDAMVGSLDPFTNYIAEADIEGYRSLTEGKYMIVPMTGGTAEHNQIAINLVTFLRSLLKGKDYRLYMNDMRLWIPACRQYTYPDVMLIEGKPLFEGDRRNTVVNSSLIIEVLSNSTKNYDKGEKFDYYRTIPEFKEYILVEQYRPYVAQYKKTNEGWLLNEYQSLDAVLMMYAIAIQIPLSEIYDLVDFEFEIASIYEDVNFD